MRRSIIPILLLILACLTGIASAQVTEPTQTPYIIYVVVTATPEPVIEQAEVPEVLQPEEETLTIVNPYANADTTSGGGTVTIVNQTTSYAGSTEELISRIVATVMAQTSATAGGTETTAGNTAAGGGQLVHLSDGSTCTASFELVSEPTYAAGALVPRGEIFWKEWLIRNTGTCTWTQDWEFVFDKGWQIGNTRFSMKRNTAPGETLTVRLAMVPDQKQNGNYYSTYAFEAPDGTRFGTITSSYTVKDPSYFYQPTPAPSKPKSGKPAGPEKGIPEGWGWWDWPWGPPPPPKHK
ncbi:MAG: hypothetical protein IJI07_02485 [Flexilinea sp.]|nr:hypothetical protein [Flexilinea sp.]